MALSIVAASGVASAAIASTASSDQKDAAETGASGADDAADIARKHLEEVLEKPGAPAPDDAPIAATKPSKAPPPATAERVSRPATDRGDPGAEDTLADAIRDVVFNNPDILDALARRDDARFARQQSVSAYLPSIDVSSSTGPERSRQVGNAYTEEDRFEKQATFRQLLFDFGQTTKAIRSSGRLVEASTWGVRSTLESISLDVATSYLGVLEKQDLYDLARDNVAAHEKILETVQAQRRFGIGSGADVSRVEAKLNAARAAVLDRESDLAQAREAFRRQVDRLPGRLAPAPNAERLVPADESTTLLATRDSNPELRQVAAQVEALRLQRAAQLAAYLPRIELEAQKNWRKNVGGSTPKGDDERVVATFRLKLFDGGAREAAYGRLGVRLRQAFNAYDRTRRDVEQRVRSEYAALSAARDKVAAIDAEVEAGKRLVELYMEQFHSGGRSVFDLLDSQETLIQARSKRVSNVSAREVSAYRVLASMGRLYETVAGEQFPLRERQQWWGSSVDVSLASDRKRPRYQPQPLD